jgi:hypothetical protein
MATPSSATTRGLFSRKNFHAASRTDRISWLASLATSPTSSEFGSTLRPSRMPPSSWACGYFERSRRSTASLLTLPRAPPRSVLSRLSTNPWMPSCSSFSSTASRGGTIWWPNVGWLAARRWRTGRIAARWSARLEVAKARSRLTRCISAASGSSPNRRMPRLRTLACFDSTASAAIRSSGSFSGRMSWASRTSAANIWTPASGWRARSRRTSTPRLRSWRANARRRISPPSRAPARAGRVVGELEHHRDRAGDEALGDAGREGHAGQQGAGVGAGVGPGDRIRLTIRSRAPANSVRLASMQPRAVRGPRRPARWRGGDEVEVGVVRVVAGDREVVAEAGGDLVGAPEQHHDRLDVELVAELLVGAQGPAPRTRGRGRTALGEQVEQPDGDLVPQAGEHLLALVGGGVAGLVLALAAPGAGPALELVAAAVAVEDVVEREVRGEAVPVGSLRLARAVVVARHAARLGPSASVNGSSTPTAART